MKELYCQAEDQKLSTARVSYIKKGKILDTDEPTSLDAIEENLPKFESMIAGKTGIFISQISMLSICDKYYIK